MERVSNTAMSSTSRSISNRHGKTCTHIPKFSIQSGDCSGFEGVTATTLGVSFVEDLNRYSIRLPLSQAGYFMRLPRHLILSSVCAAQLRLPYYSGCSPSARMHSQLHLRPNQLISPNLSLLRISSTLCRMCLLRCSGYS